VKAAVPAVVAPGAATAAKPPSFAPSFAPGGPYVVQLAALSSEAEAETEWAKRAKSAPDLFGSAEKIVVKAEVNGKTVYRLRAGAFAKAADAESFCAAFKARGGVCFRTAR
jgi:cell division septation protein DedD